jgi:hypothetical protein
MLWNIALHDHRACISTSLIFSDLPRPDELDRHQMKINKLKGCEALSLTGPIPLPSHKPGDLQEISRCCDSIEFSSVGVSDT